MKTTAVAVTALLASSVFAQPYHGRHLHKKNLHKREYVTTWVTQTETATLMIDQYGTSLIEPSPGKFYPSTSEGTTSTTSTSTSTSTTSTSTTSTPTTSTSTTPTSTYVQPTTTTQAQETTPTTTTEAPAYTQTTSVAAVPTSTSGSGSSGGGSSYSGDITYYAIGLSACGPDLTGMTPDGSSTSNPAVIAMAFDHFTTPNPNLDPICGKMIKITGNGKVGYGMVRDKCAACHENDLDLNPEAFQHFYDSSVGRAVVSWEWM